MDRDISTPSRIEQFSNSTGLVMDVPTLLSSCDTVKYLEFSDLKPLCDLYGIDNNVDPTFVRSSKINNEVRN